MDTPETKYYIGSDSYNGIHAFCIVDDKQAVVHTYQTTDRKLFDKELKKHIELYKIPSERIITEKP